MGEKKTNALSKSMKLIYVYAMATGAIFTFMCYWDGIFMSYTGPGTFLAFALMTLAVLPTAFVYAEFSTMLPSTGSCLVFNTVGINKHAGFWSAWLIMCAWIAVPAAGVLGIIEWLNHQFGLGLTGGKAVIVGSLVLCFWCVLSLYKNVVAGKVYLTTQKRVIATSFALISQWSEPLTVSPVGEANANKNACAGFKPAQAFLLS